MTTIKNVPSGTHTRTFWVEGSPEEVIKDVAHRLEEDHITPMYEHMALKIISVDISKFPLVMRICLFKNLYAGD
jgi:hypothetical protein